VQPDCIKALTTLAEFPQVQIKAYPIPGFNKAQLLNYGLRSAIADQILISDADIIWNTAAIEQMMQCAQTDAIATIEQVEESDPGAIALRRHRYTYQLSGSTLEILPAIKGRTRPGCGLICAAKTTLLRLGGYQEFFQGWGWEDQDLLIRATLAGIPIQSCGKVLHLSHSDAERNQFYTDYSVEQTRDRNILRCVQHLPSTVSIQIPKSLWND
jgi:hypothetical protein